MLSFFFFFNDTATTEIYTLSLHDALPISRGRGGDGPGTRAQRVVHPPYHRERAWPGDAGAGVHRGRALPAAVPGAESRSEEHTSELQSQSKLVCRLLLGKKKKTKNSYTL